VQRTDCQLDPRSRQTEAATGERRQLPSLTRCLLCFRHASLMKQIASGFNTPAMSATC
jgi:hypothetical protein